MGLTKLKIIGNGDAFGSGNRFQTCFLLKSEQANLLIDCGSTAVFNLKKLIIDYNSIDLIAISHFHGDHFGGIPYFLLDSFFVFKRQTPLTVIGPPECESRLYKLVDMLYPGLAEKIWTMDMTFHEYEPERSLKYKDVEISGVPVIHAPEALPHGIRVEGGENIFAYSGDTSWTDNLLNLSQDADIFVCECSQKDTEVKGHLSEHLLISKLTRFNCKRILLTHMSQEVLDNSDQMTLEMTDRDAEYLF